MPRHPDARKLLGLAYYTLGETGKAAEVYRQWLADEPESPVAIHMLSACSGENVPLRASDSYVESTFDNFAESFDAKLGKLAYRAPDLVAGALASACPEPGANLVALDAGCGTGLCGPLIAPYVRRLTGVDMSAGMLAKARGRNAYDELVKSELTAYLLAHPAAFDLVISADTLVYFGSLREVLDAAHDALRSGGLLIFTVEVMPDEATVDEASQKNENGAGYRINPHGRYSHGSDYLREALLSVGFAVLGMDPAVLRNEGGNPVAGFVITARKLNNHSA
jgi:predicted TPR repeat methyltransferase